MPLDGLPPPHLAPALHGYPEHADWVLLGALRTLREIIDEHEHEPALPRILAWWFARRGWLVTAHWPDLDTPRSPFRLTHAAREELNRFEAALGIGRGDRLPVRPR